MADREVREREIIRDDAGAREGTSAGLIIGLLVALWWSSWWPPC
jgi:hypothetical protein